jgi:ABC-type polysaccharide/polyol phosphate transport system ATPase subunit
VSGGGEKNIIDVSGVSVKYALTGGRPRTAQEFLIGFARGKVFRSESFWALKNVSFSLRKGASLGIIGPNGSGKSTLLKVLAGIIEPTEGEIRLRGSLAPLIELGAGFDPELTGEENIYLNGSILGLSRSRIAGKFQKIIEFAEVGNFIYSPLRTYSSGMLARLAFAVAVEVEADILAVDEVLSVGDEGFRKKCHQRIDDIISKGVTLLFVSHSLGEVQRLCDLSLWIDHGKARAFGESELVSRRYLLHFDKTVFGDIPLEHEYKKYIDSMFLRGITSGYIVNGERFYNPENRINRAEFAVFLSKALGLKKEENTSQVFNDVSANHWAAKYIAWIYEQGLIDGVRGDDSKLYFYPDDYITSNDLKGILSRLDAGKIEGIIRGEEQVLTRGDIARIFYEFFDFSEGEE